jgi:hypothetical protein
MRAKVPGGWLVYLCYERSEGTYAAHDAYSHGGLTFLSRSALRVESDLKATFNLNH